MNHIDLAGQAAVVTGAARGIGLAIAERLLASGARVSLWDQDAAALAAAGKALSSRGEVHAAAIDVTDFAAVEAATAEAAARFGGLHILVNNAGITGGNKPSWELDVGEWRRVIEVDLTGVFLCARAVVPRLLAAGYGRVVNIASIAGKEGNPNAAHYSAAKAGVIGFTKSLGKELAKTGVVCNCVTPAVIETDIFRQMAPEHIQYMLSRIPMGRFGQKEEAAALVAWLCSRDCSFSTGAVFDLSGGRATY
jgi:3-oxoacyl-[acyl-carrier protein] reductase